MRALALILLAACWTQTPAPSEPAPAPAAPAPAPPADAALVVDAAMEPPGCPSGTGVTARIIQISVQGSDTIVTITTGNTSGVARDWIVVQPPRCVIIRIDKDRTVLECGATSDQVKAQPYAVLCAP